MPILKYRARVSVLVWQENNPAKSREVEVDLDGSFLGDFPSHLDAGNAVQRGSYNAFMRALNDLKEDTS